MLCRILLLRVEEEERKQSKSSNKIIAGLPLYDVNDSTATVVLAEEIALSSFFLGWVAPQLAVITLQNQHHKYCKSAKL